MVIDRQGQSVCMVYTFKNELLTFPYISSFHRHSNGSTEDNNYDADFQPDDAGSLSRSDSEDNVAQIQNGHNNNNNGYTHKSL